MQLLKLCQQASGYRASGTAYTLAEIQRYKCKPNKILYLTFNYLTSILLQIYTVGAKYTIHWQNNTCLLTDSRR